MIERRTGRGAFTSADQSNLAEIIPFGCIRKDQLAAGIMLADLDEADPYEIKGVGRVPLVEDHLAWGVAHQLNLLAQVVDELVAYAGKDGNSSQVSFERAQTIIVLEF